jgi:hypothetical protein
LSIIVSKKDFNFAELPEHGDYIGSDSDATYEAHSNADCLANTCDCHEVYERHIVTVCRYASIKITSAFRGLLRKFNGVIWSEEEKIDITILTCGVVECSVHLIITKLYN